MPAFSKPLPFRVSRPVASTLYRRRWSSRATAPPQKPRGSGDGNSLCRRHEFLHSIAQQRPLRAITPPRFRETTPSVHGPVGPKRSVRAEPKTSRRKRHCRDAEVSPPALTPECPADVGNAGSPGDGPDEKGSNRCHPIGGMRSPFPPSCGCPLAEDWQLRCASRSTCSERPLSHRPWRNRRHGAVERIRPPATA